MLANHRTGVWATLRSAGTNVAGLVTAVAITLIVAASPAWADGEGATSTGGQSATDVVRVSQSPVLRPFALVRVDGNATIVRLDRQALAGTRADRRKFVVERFPLQPDRLIDLELEPFSVVGPNTRFMIGNKSGAARPFDYDPSSISFFRGSVPGYPGSHVFLALGERSSTGYVDLGPGAARHGISSKGADGRPLSRDLLSVFKTSGVAAGGAPAGVPLCGVEGDKLLRGNELMENPVQSGERGSPAVVPSTVYLKHMELAVETDYELFSLFDDETAMVDYVVQMYGAVSDIYIRYVDTHIEVVYVGIWTDPDDIINGPDPLFEFYPYWEANMSGVHRDNAQFFSGRRNFPFGGQAFLSSMCSSFGYGIIGYAVGWFPDPTKPHPFNWDVSVCAHELGHSSGTLHTQDYGLDTCDVTTGSPRRGPIMSYCGQTWSGMNANTDNYFHRVTQAKMDTHLNSSYCIVPDCNMNNVDDAIDIANTYSPDTNGNGVPDECEDCNGDSILDPANIAGGMPDLNGNGIPDVCEPDCDGNNVPDDRDILLGATDLYGDDIPDRCEADCNSNLTSDYTEIQADMTRDKNRDAILDSCQDCDTDGSPDLVELQGAHHLWVASGLNGEVIREFHPTVGVLTRDSGGSPSVNQAQDLIVTPDGHVLVSSASGHLVMRFDLAGNYVDNLVTAGSGGLSYPTGMLVKGGNRLLVCSRNTNEVLEYDLASGAPQGAFVTAGSGGLTQPFGLTIGPNGNLFVTSSTNEVLEYNGTTGSFVGKLVDAADNGTLDQPRGLTFTATKGNLLVASYGTDEVLEFDGSTGEPLGKWAQVGTATNITQDSPWGIRVGPNGHVYVSRTGTPYSSPFSSDGHDDIAESHLTDARMFEYNVRTGWFRKTHIGGNDHGLNFATGFDFVPGWDIDCNFNQIQDDCDIASGFSADSPPNGIPDECETDCNGNGVRDRLDLIPFGTSLDCNANLVPDSCDISSLSSEDCDGNGVPDECDPDCNGNGVPDGCDIGPTSDDCNGNGVPDECESQDDCNENSTQDICEMIGGAGDCNGNGVLDECEAVGSGVTLSVDFESGLPAGWITSGIFQVTGACAVNPVCDGSQWAYAGSTSGCAYGNQQSGALTSAPIELPWADTIELGFCTVVNTEAGYDFVDVRVNDDVLLREAGNLGGWSDRVIDISAYRGQTITLKFHIASDSWASGTLGWQVDDIEISYVGIDDANTNGVPDECEDCDENGVPDEDELPIQYAVDDGTGENLFGHGSGGDFIWLNQFTVQPGAETISSVDVAWGTVATHMPATIVLWDDPNNDGDPSDATVLTTVSPVPARNGDVAGDTFFRYAMPATFVGNTGDSFFVGALITHVNGEYPARLDESGSLQQSWYALNSSGAGDISNLTANPEFNQMDVAGYPGNWMVRAQGGAGQDCNGNGVLDVCDATSGVPDGNGNDILDSCECVTYAAPVANPQMVDAGWGGSPRFLSLMPGIPGLPLAIRVTFPNPMPSPYGAWSGLEMWVGPPTRYCENSGKGAAPNNTPPTYGCDPAPGQPDRIYMASTLQCDAHFMDWHGLCNGGACVGGLREGLPCGAHGDCSRALYVYHEGIIPSTGPHNDSPITPTTYSVQVVGEFCILSDEARYSTALPSTTSKWGDTVLDLTVTPYPAPEGIVQITDVLAILVKFQNLGTASVSARVDLIGATEPKYLPDHGIDIGDVLQCLFGFQAQMYPSPAITGVPNAPPCAP